MTTQKNIAAVIITHNEENNIADCIRSVIDLVDEVIVVDANSEDKTVSLAKELGATVLLKDWSTFGIQKNYGAARAKVDWVLSIDADERVDDELNEVLMTLELDSNKVYAINIKTNYLGKWIKYCGWYPSYKRRLYHKEKAEWSNDLVHENLVSEKSMKVKNLSGNLLHYSYPSIERHHQKIERYASLTAEKWKMQKKSPGLLKKIFGPSFRFIKTYIFRLGVLDGREGFLISKMSFLLVKRQLQYFKQLEEGE